MSHWNSNEKFKEKFGNYTRKPLDRFTTKDCYTWNITHNTESTAMWSLKPERWDHRWFKRSTRKKFLWQETHILYNNNNNSETGGGGFRMSYAYLVNPEIDTWPWSILMFRSIVSLHSASRRIIGWNYLCCWRLVLHYDSDTCCPTSEWV